MTSSVPGDEGPNTGSPPGSVENWPITREWQVEAVLLHAFDDHCLWSLNGGVVCSSSADFNFVALFVTSLLHPLRSAPWGHLQTSRVNVFEFLEGKESLEVSLHREETLLVLSGY